MDVYEKLQILTAAAKFDVACTSSGVDRTAPAGGFGSSVACGICHSFAADGRCISLLKILMSNACSYDCLYCVNRKGNDTPRATFTPREIAELTVNFYRRNYIEGLFLSSAVLGTANRTMELMAEAIRILREEYRFYGYIHAKVIPGADSEAIDRMGALCDRLSVNIELPSEVSLKRLAPDKSKTSILQPMGYIANKLQGNRLEYRRSNPSIGYGRNQGALVPVETEWRKSRFAPAGQSTQMIIGASDESDLSILRLTEGLYQKYKLRRVFFSAYVPVVEHSSLPAIDTKPPLLRENRLYQADWLMRFYDFTAGEILDERNPTFNPYLDPKCNWAVNHPEFFPVEINKAPYQTLLRVPGIGVLSARKIMRARRIAKLDFGDLKKLGVVLKRAKYFIICSSKAFEGLKLDGSSITESLLSKAALERLSDVKTATQLSMFEGGALPDEEVVKCLTGQM